LTTNERNPEIKQKYITLTAAVTDCRRLWLNSKGVFELIKTSNKKFIITIMKSCLHIAIYILLGLVLAFLINNAA
jgi:hypothetical protein